MKAFMIGSNKVKLSEFKEPDDGCTPGLTGTLITIIKADGKKKYHRTYCVKVEELLKKLR